MKKYYADTTPGVSKREQTNRTIAREAAQEGMVLLQNKGILPLENDKVALYGMGARKTIKGGTGSGEVNERHSVNIEEGLEGEGFTVTSKRYLEDYDKTFEEERATWREKVEKAIEGKPIATAFGMMTTIPFRYPSGRLIDKMDIEASQTDTAIYVISRQAGEGKDRTLDQGDFRITDTERTNLEILVKAYDKVVVVINVGGLLDLDFVDEIEGIGALIFYGQGGMEGGNALAALLKGKVNFSGKLTDTWAKDYFDYPSAGTFSHMNGNLEEEDYIEGIFIGYRYFNAFGVSPRYPFGYGLSYTDFRIKVLSMDLVEKEIIMKVQVSNIGEVPGKEVIQVYTQSPEKDKSVEPLRLVAFGKTCTLAPREVEILTISVDLEQMTFYEVDSAAWILEQGEHILMIGNSSVKLEEVAVIEVEQRITVEQCGNKCCPSHKIEELLPSKQSVKEISAELPIIRVGIDAIKTRQHGYASPRIEETLMEKKILDSLSDFEIGELTIGGDTRDQEKETHIILGAGGKSTIKLHGKGIGNIVMADGPAGLNIVNHTLLKEDGREIPYALPEKYNWGEIAKNHIRQLETGTGTDLYRYATAWPASHVLAQTWNLELIQKIGEGTGAEMVDFGVTLWLAPGMNIHRNPLCGRHFEYYSEDPYVSGKMAAALTLGVQSNKGVGVTIKHFACNNQEDNRTGVSSNLGERALREIYLKGFEICVKESAPWALMSSYNRINGTYTPNYGELLNDILRGEWHFNGIIMTDWYSTSEGRAKPELAALSGNDLIMPGSPYDRERICKAIESGELDKMTLRTCAGRVLRVILNSNIR